MRLKLNKIVRWAAAIIGVLSLGFAQLSGMAYADNVALSMSPPNEVILLTPGEKFTGTFTVSNGVNNDQDINYVVTVNPFFVDEEYNIYFDETEGLNQMVNWITVSEPSGTLPVNSYKKFNFTIDVPKDAPAGGQYAAITVTALSDNKGGDADGGVNVDQDIAMAHIIYAEIAGTTKRGGDVISTNLPSFIFDGNISAESTVKNTGNVHGQATYKLQVFPLFSSEEVYTNEEKPDSQLILPNRTLSNKTAWEQTPAVGIFNVKYTVEFEGVTTEVTKLVIKCPLWLLFIIIFLIVALITWLVVRARSHKKSVQKSVDTQ